MTFRSSSPANRHLTNTDLAAKQADAMTRGGVLWKFVFIFSLSMLGALYAWITINYDQDASYLGGSSLFAGSILLLTFTYRPRWTAALVVPYALSFGVLVGYFSIIANKIYPGIVEQAVLFSIGILAVMLFVYGTGLLKVNRVFLMRLYANTSILMFYYLICLVMGPGHTFTSLYYGHNIWAIALSVYALILSSLNFPAQLALIQAAVDRKASKKYEWIAATTLLTNILWLYLEVLRLSKKVRSR